mmetsp:Transcript_9445/g.57624  ORF Transcript_9445/g.57624 Transcript_9445/m.57624 type:complete len:324 (+) Transcript_9445:237-1208(+)
MDELQSHPRTMRRVVMGQTTAKQTHTWRSIVDTYAKAERNGWAYKTDTRAEFLRDSTVDATVVLRVATALRDKPKAETKKQKGRWCNPFLPYDENLWCCDLSETHVLLLNKFNVVPHHTLVVTREFKSQEDPLESTDVEALWTTLQSYPSGALAFFNSGPHSGKSQPHKHVQVIPLPLAEGMPQLPFQHLLEQAWIEAASKREGTLVDEACFSMKAFPFVNFACKLNALMSTSQVHHQYRALLDKMALQVKASPLSYNLLLTTEWMMAVPRRQESAGPVSVNALGFAGTFLLRSEEEISYIRNLGCLAVLQIVSMPWPSSTDK